MMAWPTVELQSVADLTGGNAFKSSEYSEHGMFVLRTLNINNDCSIDQENAKFIPYDLVEQYRRFELQANDTLFVMVGATLGKVGFVRENNLPALLNQNMWRVRAKKGKIDPIFLHYSFRQFCKGPLKWMSGSARGFVRRDDYRKLEIPLPEPDEQRDIAAILGALDDKIELNRKTAATLEEMARALYRSWFVDFDPVHAKRKGRAPAHMDAATAALFPDSFGENGLPEGWEFTTIGEAGNIAGGATPKTKEPSYWDDGHHLWATPKDLSSLKQPVLFDTDRKITDAGLAKISSGLSPEGTLLLSSRAPIGYLAIAKKPVAVNQGFIAIRETEKISGLEAYFWCAENMDLIHANANGSTFQEISKKNFRPLEYVLASPEVRQAFNQQAGDLFDRVSIACEENHTLAALRDTLLPRLMSGELRVGEAKEQVEAVA